MLDAVLAGVTHPCTFQIRRRCLYICPGPCYQWKPDSLFIPEHQFKAVLIPKRTILLNSLSKIFVLANFLHITTMSALCKLVSIFLAFSLVNYVVSADDCQPWQWTSKRDVVPGQVVCRYTLTSPAEVSYYTCIELADRYDISIDKFFLLNPDLDRDCKTIEPNTDYCVAGCESQ